MRDATWLDRELQRLWLFAETGLRQLQASKLRPNATGDLEAVLSTREASRGGKSDAATLGELCERADREVKQHRADSPLGHVASRLGLDALETDVLIVALAPHVDPALSELFHALRGGPRRGVTLTAITQLLRLTRADRTRLLRVLDPERPLLHWKLIDVGAGDAADGTAGSRVIAPALGALDLLVGDGGPSAALQRYARLVRAEPTFDDLVLGPELRTAALRLCHSRGPAPWTVLWGIAGAGKRALAARLAAHRDQPSLEVDLFAVEPPHRRAVLRLAQRDALVLDATLYLGPLPPSGPEVRDLLRELSTHAGTVVLGVESSRPPQLALDLPLREQALPVPDEASRLALWRAQLPGSRIEALESLARSFHLTPGEIVGTVAEARMIAEAENRMPAVADLRTGIERRMRNGLQDIAWRVDVSVSWDDLVLAPDERGRVEEFIARRVYASTVYTDWGFGKRIERGRGSIALFSGPPGTGKTMLAGLIAKGLGLDLYQVDLSQIQSRYVGETEKSLGRVFDLAERAHAVLLFDEADSLLSRRTDVETSNDRHANAHVNYLLQRLEAYSGVVVLTTNKDAALDDALQRRLTLHLRLDVPEVTERERLWESFLPAAMPRESDLDIPSLAREFELTGGYIKNVVVRAAFLAAREQRTLGTHLLRRAAVLEMEDMGRVVHLQSRAA